MGMYDNIKCLYPLPLNDELKSLNANWEELLFQTKDLDNCLSDYVISADGKLLETIIEREYIPFTDEELKSKDHKPWNLWKDIIEKKKEQIEINFHGKICFYDSIDLNDAEQIWVDFEAYFVYGKLDKIQLAKTEKTARTKFSLKELLEEEERNKKSFKYRFKKYSGLNSALLWLSSLCTKTSRILNKINTFAIRNLN